METKQTAVEWLEEKINLYNFEFGIASMRKYIEYAKQIEKEQIKDAYDEGDIQLVNAEQYYNETYGSN